MKPTNATQAETLDVEVLPAQAPKVRRRTFTAKYKLRVLREFDAGDTNARGALLRREGLYTSHICHWRKNLQLQTLTVQRGRRPVPEEQREIERLRRENEKLTAKLLKAEQVIEVQKNVYALLRSLAPENNSLSVGI
jgi:transposase-like protein